jgi:hypothetical protein
MVLLFVFCTSKILLPEFGLSNTLAQITRLESLESDNQGSSLIISGDTSRFFSPKDPSPTKNLIFLYIWRPLTQGFSCVAWFTGAITTPLVSHLLSTLLSSTTLLHNAESSCCKKNQPNKC